MRTGLLKFSLLWRLGGLTKSTWKRRRCGRVQANMNSFIRSAACSVATLDRVVKADEAETSWEAEEVEPEEVEISSDVTLE